jgi:peroxiredoxin
MNKRVMILACVVWLLSGCSTNGQQAVKEEGWTVTLRGKVGYPQQGTISIVELTSKPSAWQDTIQLAANYTFAKKVKLKEPGYYKINFYNRQAIDIIVYKSDLEINVDGHDPSGFYEVKGSPDMELIREVQSLVRGVESTPEAQKLIAEFNQAQAANNQDRIADIQQQYMQLSQRYTDMAVEKIRQAPLSLGAINLLQGNLIDKDQYFSVYLELAERLKKEWPTYTHAQDFVAMVDKMKTLALGSIAPEISLPDPNGQVVKLSSLRGKYVLVDFWAKWCGPCRRENPNVVKAYNKHKENGFTVYGVSLDRTKEDWLQAIREDGLTWTHVSDLKYWQSEAAKTYNVNAIPFSLLLDPNGVIIAKNLRGAALDAKLDEIFEAKN